MGIALEGVKDEPVQGNTAVNLLEFDGEEVRVVFQGDDTHLATEKYAYK